MSQWETLLCRSSLDPVLRIDRAGYVVDANDAAVALFGNGSGTPVGKPILAALHQRTLSEMVSGCIASGTPADADVRARFGSDLLLHARATPVPEALGGGAILTLDDRSELAHLRTVRTEFVANVSHELRTPLASIRALAETLVDGAITDTEVSSRFLATIVREVDRLVRLSEDLLMLARVESSERTCTVFDLRDLLAEVAERLTPYAERRGVALHTAVGSAPLWIEADRGEIDQIFFNLLDNGIKYTPEGGKVTATVCEEGSVARAVVEDTGIGMLSEDLPRIFERFWRADRARKFPSEGGTATSGTGLGLSIVKHIVESHGGGIGVESEFGRGSRLTVTLPLSQPAPALPVPNDE